MTKTTDYLVKSITKDGKFRAYAVNATQLVEKAHEIHDTWSASSAALDTDWNRSAGNGRSGRRGRDDGQNSGERPGWLHHC